jgi:hypothetical protein
MPLPASTGQILGAEMSTVAHVYLQYGSHVQARDIGIGQTNPESR